MKLVYRSYIQRQVEKSCIPYPLIDGVTEVVLVSEIGEVDEEITEQVKQTLCQQRMANCIARNINRN